MSMSEKIVLCLVLVLLLGVVAHASTDVVDYSATLEPDITNKSVKGSVLIRVLTNSDEVVLDCGELIVDSVTENGRTVQFSVKEHKLRVSLAGDSGRGDLKRKTERKIQRTSDRTITVTYHGAPRRGIRFFPDRQQVYTVFSTSQWMVCNDDPADKATFTLKLVVPSALTAVANGELVSQHNSENGKRIY